MKRLLTLALLCGATLASADTGYYIAGTASYEHLRYDVDAWLNRKLAVDHRGDYLRLIELAGGSMQTSTKLSNVSYKGTIGYQASDRLAYEVGVRHYQRHAVRAELSASGEVLNISTSLGGHSANLTASASGSASAMAELTASSLSGSLVYRLHGPIFVRGGIEYAIATTTQTTTDNLSYDYALTVDGTTTTGGKVKQSITSEKQYYRVALPLIGAGIDYKLDKRWSWRSEIEHVGLLRQGFDFISLSLIYRF